MLIIVLAPLNVYFLGHLYEMKKIIFESNVQMKKWFVCRDSSVLDHRDMAKRREGGISAAA